MSKTPPCTKCAGTCVCPMYNLTLHFTFNRMPVIDRKLTFAVRTGQTFTFGDRKTLIDKLKTEP